MTPGAQALSNDAVFLKGLTENMILVFHRFTSTNATYITCIQQKNSLQMGGWCAASYLMRVFIPVVMDKTTQDRILQADASSMDFLCINRISRSVIDDKAMFNGNETRKLF